MNSLHSLDKNVDIKYSVQPSSGTFKMEGLESNKTKGSTQDTQNWLQVSSCKPILFSVSSMSIVYAVKIKTFSSLNLAQALKF